MPTAEMLARFQRLENGEFTRNDIYIQQIVQIHGPFDVGHDLKIDPYSVTICLACHMVWPCRTFEILEDREKVFTEIADMATKNLKSVKRKPH